MLTNCICNEIWCAFDKGEPARYSGDVGGDGIRTELYSEIFQSLWGNAVVRLCLSDNTVDPLFLNGFSQKNYGRRYNVEVLTEIIVRLQNQDKTKQKNKKDQSSLANKLKQQSAPASSQRFPAPQHLKQNLSPNTSPDANGNHYSGYNGNQRHGQHHAHSQSSQIPSNFSQSHFQKGDIVLYQGQQAEVMRVMDNMVEVSYPASQYIMNRRKTTVNPMELQVFWTKIFSNILLVFYNGRFGQNVYCCSWTSESACSFSST